MSGYPGSTEATLQRLRQWARPEYRVTPDQIEEIAAQLQRVQELEDIDRALTDIAQRRQVTIDALERFKAYVHQRLDEAGIPTHPDGEHSKAGCRIGDRLDLALAKVPKEGT